MADKTYFWFDPPSGWKFGFPKCVSKTQLSKPEWSLNKWLTDNGYPQELIDEMGDRFMVSCWETVEE